MKAFTVLVDMRNNVETIGMSVEHVSVHVPPINFVAVIVMGCFTAVAASWRVLSGL